MDFMSDEWLESLPQNLIDLLQNQSNEVVAVICERIKEIGKLSATDTIKLTNSLEYAGADLKKIEIIIQKYTLKSQQEINEIFDEAAQKNSEFADTLYKARNLEQGQVLNNAYFTSLLDIAKRRATEEYGNYSDSYAFKFPGKKAMSIRQTYTQCIDKAIFEVKSGVMDYNTAIRKTVKDLADSGLRTADYASGVSRRMDTAVRMNVIDTVRQMSADIQERVGEQVGADGVELSAHALCAPDHLPIQGKQFSNTEFEKMQSSQAFEDINGNQYEPLERHIMQWNCKHFPLQIIIGVSEPLHSEQELKDLADNSEKKYLLSQEQRRLETELRTLKDERLAMSKAGNDTEAKRIQTEINKKQKEYTAFCKRSGLTPQPERARVNGYRRIKTS